MVGMDALSIGDRLKIEAARSLREDYLQQDAFNEVDTYASGNKQAKMLGTVFLYYDLAKDALERRGRIFPPWSLLRPGKRSAG